MKRTNAADVPRAASAQAFTIPSGRFFCRSDEAAGADGGRDAGSSRGEIYWAELDWLFAVAAVSFPCRAFWRERQ